MRVYKKKSDRKSPDPELVLRAVRMVKVDRVKQSVVSAKFNMNYRTLGRYVKTLSDEDVFGETQIPTTRTLYLNRQVIFSACENWEYN